MPTIISHDLLVGRFQVTQNNKATDIVNEYIDSVEKSTIIKMLGADLGNEFWDDLDSEGAPVEQRFLDIFEPFEFDDGCGIVESKGIIHILLAFACVAYLRDADQTNSDTGNQSPKGENSVRINPRSRIVKIYNEAIASVKAIQWYIEEHKEDYEGYNGQHFGYYLLF